MEDSGLLLHDFGKDAIIIGNKSVSFKEMICRISIFADTMPKENHEKSLLPATERNKIVLFSENREGYIYAFFSILENQSIAIPVDAESNVNEILYVLNDCEPIGIWTSKSRRTIVESAVKQYGKNLFINYIDDYENETISPHCRESLVSYHKDQIALIIYTSGTVSAPKGVLLSYRNLLRNVEYVSKDVKACTPERRAIILLPLHHIFPLVASMLVPMIIGAGVAITPSLSVHDITSTMKEAKIGMLIGVPRLWDTLYKSIMKEINSSILFRSAYTICKVFHNLTFSRIIFWKIHNSLGGNLRCCPSGGAALSPEVWRGMYTLGIEIIEGYGMTECGPLISFNRPNRAHPDSAGELLDGCEVKIIDGEICVKGENVTSGYYNNPEATAELFDSEGWLHTGDIGDIDKDRHLHIIGRKKELIVLPNGKKIIPEEVEHQLSLFSNFVKETSVLLEDNRLKAIILPNDDYITADAKIIQEQVIDKYNQNVHPSKWIHGLYITHNELPKTKMGKLQRYKLKDIVIEHKPEADITETPGKQDETIRILCEYINSEKQCDASQNDNLIIDLNFDSLDFLKLSCFICSVFNKTIPVKDLALLNNVGKIAQSIDVKMVTPFNSHYDWNMAIEQVKKTDTKQKVPTISKIGWHFSRVIRPLLSLYFNLKHNGLDRISEQNQFIMVSNHQCYLDSLFIISGISRSQYGNLCFLVKQEHASSAFVRKLLKSHRAIVIGEDNIDECVTQICQYLKSGLSLLIFPEGTRTGNGRIGRFKPLFAILCKSFNIPVFPVCIEGAFESMPKGRKFPRKGNVRVSFLPYIFPQEHQTADSITIEAFSLINQHMSNVTN